MSQPLKLLGKKVACISMRVTPRRNLVAFKNKAKVSLRPIRAETNITEKITQVTKNTHTTATHHFTLWSN